MTYKFKLASIVALLILATLVACGSGGGSGDRTGISGIIVTPKNNIPRFAYVANSFDNTVSIYTVNADTGQLRHNGYVVTEAAPQSVTVDPSGKFVYVANRSSDSISAYNINNSTGALTPIKGIGVPAGGIYKTAPGSAPVSITTDPTGKFAYVSNWGTNATNAASSVPGSISAYTIDATTGALNEISQNGSAPAKSVSAGSNPTFVTVDPTGKFAYVANQNSDSVSAYAINLRTDVLVPVGALIPVDADDKVVGIQNFATDLSPHSVTVTHSGKFAYVANRGSNSVSAYRIDPGTGALNRMSFTAATEKLPRDIIVDPTDKFAYVTNFGSDTVSAYAIHPDTGTLSFIETVKAGITPHFIVVDPSGKFVYVSDYSSTVSTYRINASGALTPLSTIEGGSGSWSIAMTHGTKAVSYVPKFAYVANRLSNSISAYAINATAGLLNLVANSNNPSASNEFPAGIDPRSYVAVDPTGKFAYVANFNEASSVAAGSSLSAYTIDTNSGALTPIDANPTQNIPFNNFATGLNPHAVAIDPAGKFVYVANWGSGSVSAYVINATNGRLAPIDADPVNTPNTIENFIAGTSPLAIGITPSGKFVYVVNQGGGVSAYSINNINGFLTRINAGTTATIENFPTGSGPRSIAIDPTGKFAYVTNEGGNSVSAYTINAVTGVLTPIDANPAVSNPGIDNFTAGISPSSVAVDPTGKFAYVGNNGTNTISTYQINATTGALTLIGTVDAGNGPISVSIDASGKFAYVTNKGGVTGVETGSVNSVWIYSIDPVSGILSKIGTIATGKGPWSISTTGTIQ